ncbi:glycosyltransferase [Patescibacteria group bacterium]|nr:glycosyltransferase [Patescibacteria group bacterium]
MKLSVVFPVHNEEGNMDELIRRSNKTLSDYYNAFDLKNQSAFELILVDDASTDKSADIIKRWANDFPHVRYIHHDKSRGQTGAFKSGFDAARGEIVITMDSDLEVLPEDIPLFLEKMKEGYQMVNGVRIDRKHEGLIVWQSRAYNVLMKLFFLSPFKDNASNYTSFVTAMVRGLPLTDNDHRYLYPILRTRGLRKSACAEVGVRHILRTRGVSKYGRFKAVTSAFEMFPAWWRVHSGRYKFTP